VKYAISLTECRLIMTTLAPVSLSADPKPAASTKPKSLLEIQNLRPHPQDY